MEHQRTVLQFSGGKDSLACLHLLKARWNKMTVVWVNPGAPFPETVALMDEIKSMVPHFLEVRSEQSIEQQGYPVDLLPIDKTDVGQRLEGLSPYRFQSRLACCAFSLWIPTAKAMKELGATTIIRGQKLSDRRKGPLRHGAVVEGITYEFPLEGWTDDDVLRYLAEKKVALPANYAYMATGLDCWNCTAYLDENAGRLRYMRERHPEKHAAVHDVLEHLSRAASRHSLHLEQILRE
jgi:3'-phosphoadenosine 5'-phosphosulfate sulfotransferase (PAPS reductase)/FAD synthetase